MRNSPNEFSLVEGRVDNSFLLPAKSEGANDYLLKLDRNGAFHFGAYLLRFYQQLWLRDNAILPIQPDRAIKAFLDRADDLQWRSNVA